MVAASTSSERVGGNAWQLGVATYASETPDAAATLKAIQGSTPAGIVITYTTNVWDYTLVKAANATYTALRSAHPTYDDVLAGGS